VMPMIKAQSLGSTILRASCDKTSIENLYQAYKVYFGHHLQIRNVVKTFQLWLCARNTGQQHFLLLRAVIRNGNGMKMFRRSAVNISISGRLLAGKFLVWRSASVLTATGIESSGDFFIHSSMKN
jgi:hypothetical protein